MSVTEISPISTMYTSIYTVTGLPGKYKNNTIFDQYPEDLTWQNTRILEQEITRTRYALSEFGNDPWY